MRIDLFGDNRVYAEYYPHKCVDIKLDSLRVVVNKPFGTRLCKNSSFNYTLETPSIQISSNTTSVVDLKYIELLNKSILKAIEILNSENDGLIINKDFSVDNARELNYDSIPDKVKELHKTGKAARVKSIPYKEIAADTVYEDNKGHKWMYLGEGFLYHNGCKENRANCKYIYLNFDELCCTQWDLAGHTILLNKFVPFLLDSYATKKRFIKALHKFDSSVNRIVVEDNKLSHEYVFIED